MNTAGPSGPSQRKLQATLPMGIGARPDIQLMGIRIEMTKKTTAERSTLLVRLNETGGKATGATQIATGQSTPPIAIFPLTLYLFPLLHQSWSGHVGSPDIGFVNQIRPVDFLRGVSFLAIRET
jgi:hypothetical protein